MAREWRQEQRRLQREIDRHEIAEQSSMDEGVQKILELAQNAQRCSSSRSRAKSAACSTLLTIELLLGGWCAGLRSANRLIWGGNHPIVARQSADDTANSAKRANWLTLPDKPSIAVLPFQNMSGDPEQKFAEGTQMRKATGGTLPPKLGNTYLIRCRSACELAKLHEFGK
jgi:hypothetical protein